MGSPDATRIYRCESCGSFKVQVPPRGAYTADVAADCTASGGARAARCIYKRLSDAWPGCAEPARSSGLGCVADEQVEVQ